MKARAKDDPLTEWQRVAWSFHGYEIEEWLRLYVRPQPWWMPGFLWRRLLRSLIVLRRDGKTAVQK